MRSFLLGIWMDKRASLTGVSWLNHIICYTDSFLSYPAVLFSFHVHMLNIGYNPWNSFNDPLMVSHIWKALHVLTVVVSGEGRLEDNCWETGVKELTTEIEASSRWRIMTEGRECKNLLEIFFYVNTNPSIIHLYLWLSLSATFVNSPLHFSK